MKAKKPGRPRARQSKKFKGPSDKIQSLAAISLGSKIGYLHVKDLSDSADGTLTDTKLQSKKYDEGERIFPRAKSEPILFLVKKGKVATYRLSSAGKRLPIKTIEAGSIFGEMPAIGQTMLGAEAEAAEPTEVTLVRTDDIDALVNGSKGFAAKLIASLGAKIVEAEKQHEQAAFQTVTFRVASLLLELAGSEKAVSGYTHQELADMLGVYRETVTVAISKLKKAKMIGVGRKKITLLDTEGLKGLDLI